MTRPGIFYAAVWLTCMVPFSVLLAQFGEPTARTFWRWWGVL